MSTNNLIMIGSQDQFTNSMTIAQASVPSHGHLPSARGHGGAAAHMAATGRKSSSDRLSSQHSGVETGTKGDSGAQHRGQWSGVCIGKADGPA